MAIGGDWWAHYTIQIAGPLAIGLAILIRDGWPSVARRRRPLVAVGLAALLLAPYHVAVRGDADERSLALFHNSGYVVEDEVAAYLQANTPPETPIFVAFNTAAIYYLADRPATYRYFFNQELRAFPNAEAQLVPMLAGPNRPEGDRRPHRHAGAIPGWRPSLLGGAGALLPRRSDHRRRDHLPGAGVGGVAGKVSSRAKGKAAVRRPWEARSKSAAPLSRAYSPFPPLSGGGRGLGGFSMPAAPPPATRC
jgi:hypothetical protein